MNTAYLFTGLPGSGKSTIAREMIKTDPKLVIICADELGQMLKGGYAAYSSDENFRPTRALVAQIAQEAARRAIENGYDFIIDETLLSQEAREKWIRFIYVQAHMQMKKYKVTIAVFPQVSVTESLKNRMKNSKGVSRETWKRIITGMSKRQEPVSSDELLEYQKYISDIGVCQFLRDEKGNISQISATPSILRS